MYGCRLCIFKYIANAKVITDYYYQENFLQKGLNILLLLRCFL